MRSRRTIVMTALSVCIGGHAEGQPRFSVRVLAQRAEAKLPLAKATPPNLAPMEEPG